MPTVLCDGPGFLYLPERRLISQKTINDVMLFNRSRKSNHQLKNNRWFSPFLLGLSHQLWVSEKWKQIWGWIKSYWCVLSMLYWMINVLIARYTVRPNPHCTPKAYSVLRSWSARLKILLTICSPSSLTLEKLSSLYVSWSYFRIQLHWNGLLSRKARWLHQRKVHEIDDHKMQHQ